ncbi:hypothetical protein [Mycobacterium leprae]|nr:hypothetical protein [Mycobacterium leprae]
MRGFHPDIEGLRAVAVFAVLCYLARLGNGNDRCDEVTTPI